VVAQAGEHLRDELLGCEGAVQRQLQKQAQEAAAAAAAAAANAEASVSTSRDNAAFSGAGYSNDDTTIPQEFSVVVAQTGQHLSVCGEGAITWQLPKTVCVVAGAAGKRAGG
jgi:hypothetical protein